MHANVAESRRPLCTSHSCCTRQETEAIRDHVCMCTGRCVQPVCLYAINLLACGMVVDGRMGVWMAGWVVRGRRCYTPTVGVSRIYWWACPIKPDPSGNLIVNKAEIQTNNTGSSSMGGPVGLEWCGIPTVDLQGNRQTQPTDLDVCLSTDGIIECPRKCIRRPSLSHTHPRVR